MSSEAVNPASHIAAAVADRTPHVVRPEHDESSLTRLLEQQAAKVPSHVFLGASLCTIAASGICDLAGHPRLGHFFGLWSAPLLFLGVYNKLVKVSGPS